MSINLLAFIINSDFGQDLIESLKGAKTTKQTELGVNNLSGFLIPLPPIEEHQIIIDRVEYLLQKCVDIEKEVASNDQHSKKLMEIVLKGAFESRKEVVHV